MVLYLLVVGCNVCARIPIIGLELYAQALLPADLQAPDAADQLCAFASEHGPNDQLDASSLFHFTQVFQVNLVSTLAVAARALIAEKI